MPRAHCATSSSNRLYSDLKRGWRITMPNLEQVGLLQVRYVSLPEIGRRRGSGGTATSWRPCTSACARELAGIMLDEFRRVLAIDVRLPHRDVVSSASGGARSSICASRGRWPTTNGSRTPGVVYAVPGRAAAVATTCVSPPRGLRSLPCQTGGTAQGLARPDRRDHHRSAARADRGGSAGRGARAVPMRPSATA